MVAACIVAVGAAVGQANVSRPSLDTVDLHTDPFDPARGPDAFAAQALAAFSGDRAATSALIAALSDEAAASLRLSDLDAVTTSMAGEQPVSAVGVANRTATSLVVLVQGRHDLFALTVGLDPNAPDRLAGLIIVPILDPPKGPMGNIEVALACLAGLLLVGVGAFAKPRRGWFVVAGVGAFATLAELLPWASSQNVAVLATPFALVAALLAVCPAPARLAVGAIAACGALAPLLAVLSVDFGRGMSAGHLGTLRPLVGHTAVLQAVGATISAASALIVGGYLVGGPLRRSVTARRAASFRLVGGAAACATLVGVGLSGLLWPAAMDLTASGWSSAALLAVGIGRAAEAGRRQHDLTAINAHVADLGAGGDHDLSLAIGRALDDPSATVLYRRDDAYVDRDGIPVALPDDTQRFTLLRSSGELLGALVHDPGATDDRDRLDSACIATRLSLEHERLAAVTRAQLHEVRASRQRLVRAEEQARRRLERDLHDGAQQRLTAALLALRVAQGRSRQTDGRMADEIDPVAVEIERAIGEIRELARGVRPSALDGGLVAAVEGLAERAPLPVTVRASRCLALGPEIETAAYFVISEALTNVARHAAATHVDVELDAHAHGLVIRVRDDGSGIEPSRAVARGVRPPEADGTGLVGIFDRVDAHGGALVVVPGPVAGTAVEVTLPCAPSS